MAYVWRSLLRMKSLASVGLESRRDRNFVLVVVVNEPVRLSVIQQVVELALLKKYSPRFRDAAFRVAYLAVAV